MIRRLTVCLITLALWMVGGTTCALVAPSGTTTSAAYVYDESSNGAIPPAVGTATVVAIAAAVGAAPAGYGSVLGTTTGEISAYDRTATYSPTTFAVDLLDALDGQPLVSANGDALCFPADVIAAETATTGGRSVDEVLNSLQKGKQSFVRTVPDEQTLHSTFGELTQGGTPTTWKNYNGQVFELQDGTQIGMRGTSSSGGSTVDIRIPGQDPFKIHIR